MKVLFTFEVLVRRRASATYLMRIPLDKVRVRCKAITVFRLVDESGYVSSKCPKICKKGDNSRKEVEVCSDPLRASHIFGHLFLSPSAHFEYKTSASCFVCSIPGTA